MSAIAFRLPYDPAFAGRNARRNVSASVGLAKSRRRARARVGALTPPDTSTRDLAVYVGAPSLGGALVGGLIAGLPGALIVMLLAGGSGYLLLRNANTMSAGDLCIKDLPEPNRGIALAAMAGTDSAKLTSLSTQSDARGWHCAATEMHARLKELGAADFPFIGAGDHGGVVVSHAPGPSEEGHPTADTRWPNGTPCAVDMAKLDDGERAAADGSAIPSYKKTAWAAAYGTDTAEMRRVADLLRKRAAMLSDPVAAKYGYLPSAKCLENRANDLDGIVVSEHIDLGS